MIIPMVTAAMPSKQGGPLAPLWIRRPGVLHLGAYSVAALVFTGEIVAVVLTGSDWPTALSVLLAGGGVVLSWWRPWAGLVVTSAASFAVTAVGRDPLSVWMMAVVVLFSFTLRGGGRFRVRAEFSPKGAIVT